MEYFWSESGHRPYLEYRFKVQDCTNEMFKWCQDYHTEGKYFRRFHVEWAKTTGLDHDVVQFEWEQAAIEFALRWL